MDDSVNNCYSGKLTYNMNHNKAEQRVGLAGTGTKPEEMK